MIISRLLVELFNHPKISDSLAFLNQWNTNVFDLWMFYLKETNEWIGRSGLRRINLNGSEEIEIGYALIVTEDTLDNLAATWDENHAKE